MPGIQKLTDELTSAYDMLTWNSHLCDKTNQRVEGQRAYGDDQCGILTFG